MSTKPGAGGPKLRRLNMGQVFIILAVVSAVLTIFVFKSLVSPNKGPVAPTMTVQTKPLVVASHEIFAGEVVTPDSIKVIDWPEKQYPNADVFQSPEKIVGHVAKNQIFPGEPLYKQALDGENSQGGLPVIIPHGYRAMTILVTENKDVGGFVRPGDHVDVVGSFEYRIPEATQKSVSEKSGLLLQDSFHVAQTILQDVQVLAIAQDMYEKKNLLDQATQSKNNTPPPPTNNPSNNVQEGDTTKGKIVSSVTLAVTPEQAEKLAFADSRGELRLALRPEDEHEQVHLIGAIGEDIVPLKNLYEKIQEVTGSEPDLFVHGKKLDQDAANAPPMPAPMPIPQHEVQVFEGTNSSRVSF